MENADVIDVSTASDERGYAEIVEELLGTGSADVITNSLPAHAAALYSAFLRHARESVLIFCRSLAAPVFDRESLVSQGEAAVARGVRINVVVQQDRPDPSSFTRWLVKTSGGDGGLVAVRSCAANSSTRNLATNFAVMDQRAYRLERDREAVRAVACMNAPSDARRLAAVFEVIFNGARDLDLAKAQ